MMNKLILLLILSLLLYHDIQSQVTEIKWSPYGNKERNEVLKVVNKLIRTYVESDFKNIQKYFSFDEVNYGGEAWLKTQQFISMIQTLRGKNEIEIGEIQAFTMDDAEKNPVIKANTLKIYRVFSNLSIFVTVELIDKTKGTRKTIFLNLILDNNKKWIVNSFTDISIPFKNISSFPQDRFRIESYEELKFDLPIPNIFNDGHKAGTQTTYTLTGETNRDASIQVDWNELKAPLGILSYNYVQYIVNQYNYSGILIKYLPYGYIYEYSVKDRNGILNKGITTAFESNNKFVYIQYFSFADTYNKIRDDIDMMFRSLKLKE